MTILETPQGKVRLRPEQPADADFLFTLFRSHAIPDLAHLDEPIREALVRMQFRSQSATYRAQYPEARFDVIELDGQPIGRVVVDDGVEVACIVDIALLAERRARGVGGAVMAAVVARLAAAGRCAVRCQVLWNNAASLRMCRRAGFTIVGDQPPFLQLEFRPG